MISQLINTIDGFVWGPIMIGLCLICGFALSFMMKFPQIRLFKEMCRCAFKGDKGSAGTSPFQALSIAVGGRVGTGNITGTAGAICFGGPGAVFWMWFMSIICAPVGYAESVLAQIWKRKKGNEYIGGPATYMEKGIHAKGLAIFYSVFTLIYLVIFAGLQSNSFAASAVESFSLPPIAWSVIYTVLVAVVIFGGVSRIANVAEKAVPIMSVAYIILALIVCIANADKIPGHLIFVYF